MSSRWPIFVVTGANGGVGFGVCHRLLLQLSHTVPEDSRLRFKDVVDETQLQPLHFEPCEGLTLIMACRSLPRAEAARNDLYRLLDEDLARRKAAGTYDSHAARFRENLRIELQQLDLASMASVFKAAEEISQKHSYVSHIVLNAGAASFSGINWWIAAKQLLTDLIHAITAPRYNIPRIGERSLDGLGWVWQCNVFGHYAFVRELQSRLAASARTPLGPARVIWMSSAEASPYEYDPDDWQLVNAFENYALSKYQIDLIATRLDADAVASGKPEAPRHIIVQPGIAATSIANSYHTWFTIFWMHIFFWLGRALGSPHHTIDTIVAAVSATHVALVPLPALAAYYSAFAREPDRFKRSYLKYIPSVRKGANPDPLPPSTAPLNRPALRFGSESNRHREALVGMTEVREWPQHEAESVLLRDRMEGLYQQLLYERKHPEELQVESFTGM